MADRNNQPGGFDAWRRAQERAQERPREDERGQAADMQGGLPEEARIGLSWNEWGTIWKTARSQQTSLFWNHNSADNDAHCCINASIRNNETGELQRMSQIYGDADTHLKFGVAGGSDFPHFRIKLTHKPTKQTSTICFMAWTRAQAPGAADRQPSLYPTEFFGGPLTFSQHLVDVEWNRQDAYHPLVVENRHWEETDATYPLLVTWRLHESPIAFNMWPDETQMSPESRRMFADFRYLVPNAMTIRLVVRCFGRLQGSWDFFSAMPAPSPPTWWRYSDVTVSNQAIIKDLPPLDFGSELFMHHCSRDQNRNPVVPESFDPMARYDTYLDERHYEVCTVGSFLRQVAAQDRNYDSYYNHEYIYDLTTTQSLDPGIYSAHSFLISLRVTGKPFVGQAAIYHPDDAQRLAFWPFYSAQQPLRYLPTDAGIFYRADDTNAPLAPQPGTDVTIKSDDFVEEFRGTVVSTDRNLVTMEVKRHRGVGTVVMSNRTGRFTFNNPSAPFKVAMVSIQKAMHERRLNNWLKPLLLAHSNDRLQHPILVPNSRSWMALFAPLNIQQNLAFQRAVYESRFLDDKVTIIQGPPGTGKTRVLGMIATNCAWEGRPFLLVAETHYAVGVCAERVTEHLQVFGDNLEGIWVIGRQGIESAEFTTSDDPEDGLLASSFDASDEINLPARSRANIIALLRKQSAPKPLSLAVHISDRFHIFQEQDSLIQDQDEHDLLEQLERAQETVECLNQVEVEREAMTSAFKHFDKVWRNLQEYYIRTKARGLMMTAPTAMISQMRAFRPHFIIIDEASRLTEAATVAVMGRFPTATKDILMGDPKQIDPFGFLEKTEFTLTQETSLLVRWTNTGVPVTMLQEQFRMHPDISATVSHLYYSGLLRDSPRVSQPCPEHNIWRRFHHSSLRNCALRHSIFANVATPSLFRTKKDKSLVNPHHLAVMAGAINALKDAGSRNDQIAVITPYKGQLSVIRNLGLPHDHNLTVDAVHGREFDFVLLDLVTPGAGYGLGFMTDMKRQCVALSRAKFGLVILGSRNMADVEHKTQGVKALQAVVSRHVAARALLDINVAHLVPGLMAEHESPGIRYEEIPRRGVAVWQDQFYKFIA